MTYQPRVNIAEGAIPTGRTVDGTDVLVSGLSHTGTMATGITRSVAITSIAPAKSIDQKGGASQAGGDFIPCPGNASETDQNLAWTSSVDFVSSLYRIKSGVGTSFTGGSVLSDGNIIHYFIQ